MRRRGELVCGVLASLFALLQLRLILALFGDSYDFSVEASRGVLDGRPHWRVFQNRVLGPLVVAGLERLTRDPRQAYMLFTVVALTVAGGLAWRLGARLGRSPLAALCLFEVLFAGLLTRPWLYAWDFVGLVIFFVFVEAVLAARPWPWFVALFAVAIFNRESAEFIALWMVLDPVARHARGARFDRAMALAGLACFAVGIGVVEALRRALLVEEVGPRLFPEAAAQRGPEVHYRLAENLAALRAAPNFENLVVVYFLALLVLLVVRLAFHDPPRLVGLALVHLGLLAALVLFGSIFETRIYLEFVPVAVAGVLLLAPDR
jgi:hypothetical protein